MWFFHVLYFQRTAKTCKILLTHKITQPYVPYPGYYFYVRDVARIIRIHVVGVRGSKTTRFLGFEYTPAVILSPPKQFFGVPDKIKAFSSFYLCRIIRARNFFSTHMYS